jgi:hypothetical protein
MPSLNIAVRIIRRAGWCTQCIVYVYRLQADDQGNFSIPCRDKIFSLLIGVQANFGGHQPSNLVRTGGKGGLFSQG